MMAYYTIIFVKKECFYGLLNQDHFQYPVVCLQMFLYIVYKLYKFFHIIKAIFSFLNDFSFDNFIHAYRSIIH